MLHRVACTRLLAEFQEYLSETYGADWLLSRQTAETVRSQGPFPTRKRSKGVEETSVHEELLKDLHAGVDAISRFFNSDW
jgi:hypothetical protein